MPADDSKNEQRQQKQTDAMSTATQKPAEEPRPAIPVFSYAQAAKGKAPSVPATPSLSMALSDTAEHGAKKDTSSETNTTLTGSKTGSGKRTASEGGKPQGDEFKSGTEKDMTRTALTNGTEKETEPVAPSNPGASAPETTSNSPSPDFGTTSVSTLPPKEDDAFSAANESSESTWDKQSQSSQNGGKNGDKANTEKENAQGAVEPSWDEEKPEPASLKEAPPPPVNFWTARMAQTPKAKPQQTSVPQTLKPAALTNGVSNASESAKMTEPNSDAKKPDGKRKAKGVAEDRPTMKEGSKSADGKAKNGEGNALPLPKQRLFTNAHRCNQIKCRRHGSPTTSWRCSFLADPRLCY